METMTDRDVMRVDQIEVETRIRSDMGNIEALAEDIKTNGLINPILVTDEKILVAGERRLEALKLLGEEYIPVTIVIADEEEERIRLEIAENEQRKEFTREERVKYGLELERIERVKAKERQATLNNKTLVENFPQAKEGQGERNDLNIVENFPPSEEIEPVGKVRDIVAQKVGLGSGKTYEKAKTIVEKAPPEIKEAWNREEISTHRAIEQMKEAKIIPMTQPKEKPIKPEVQAISDAIDEKYENAKKLRELFQRVNHKEFTEKMLRDYQAVNTAQDLKFGAEELMRVAQQIQSIVEEMNSIRRIQ